MESNSRTSPLRREGLIEIRRTLPLVVGEAGSEFLDSAVAALRVLSHVAEGIPWTLGSLDLISLSYKLPWGLVLDWQAPA